MCTIDIGFVLLVGESESMAVFLERKGGRDESDRCKGQRVEDVPRDGRIRIGRSRIDRLDGDKSQDRRRRIGLSVVISQWDDDRVPGSARWVARRQRNLVSGVCGRCVLLMATGKGWVPGILLVLNPIAKCDRVRRNVVHMLCL